MTSIPRPTEAAEHRAEPASLGSEPGGAASPRPQEDPPLLAGGLLGSGPPAPRHQLQVVQAVVHSDGVEMHHLKARGDAPPVPLPREQTVLQTGSLTARLSHAR